MTFLSTTCFTGRSGQIVSFWGPKAALRKSQKHYTKAAEMLKTGGRKKTTIKRLPNAQKPTRPRCFIKKPAENHPLKISARIWPDPPFKIDFYMVRNTPPPCEQDGRWAGGVLGWLVGWFAGWLLGIG